MARIVVIGSGFVGQATGKGFAKRGHSVVFCDTNPKVLEGLASRGFDTCLPEDLAGQGDMDIFFLAVPTPTIEGEANLSFVRDAAVSLAQGALRMNGKYCLVVPRSTMLPGTTENMIVPILQEHSGKTAGREFGVCVNPEYLREATNEQDFNDPRLIVIGQSDEEAGRFLENLYAQHFSCPIRRESLLWAELHKLAHNAVNAMIISMGNEVGMLCEALGIDPMSLLPALAESAEGRWNPLYGLRRIGHFGGSCLPKDSAALERWAENFGTSMLMLQAALQVNLAMVENNGGFNSLPRNEKQAYRLRVAV